jgi:hypothetical protein
MFFIEHNNLLYMKTVLSKLKGKGRRNIALLEVTHENLYHYSEAQNRPNIVRATHVMVVYEGLFKTDPPDVPVGEPFVSTGGPISGTSTVRLYAL